MARMPLYTERAGLDGPRLAVFDSVVTTRGSMIRPYEVLLHTPGIALPAAELGQQIRYQGSLADHDRELAILTVSVIADCQFEWDQHIEIARQAGVSEAALRHLRGSDDALTEGGQLVVGFVLELVQRKTVTDERFTAAQSMLGNECVIELTALVGYYMMLAYVMNVAGAS